MSTIRALTLQDRGTNRSLSMDRAIRGAAKAHATANQTFATPTLSNAFNVSSIGDLGPGQTRFNIASPLTGVVTPIGMGTSFTVASGSAAGTLVDLNCYAQSGPLQDAVAWMLLHGDMPA